MGKLYVTQIMDGVVQIDKETITGKVCCFLTLEDIDFINKFVKEEM